LAILATSTLDKPSRSRRSAAVTSALNSFHDLMGDNPLAVTALETVRMRTGTGQSGAKQ
jgi:hypothetical protein